MLNPHCDFELWPHPWHRPLIFKVTFWKSRNSGMGCPIDMEQKGCESTECWTHVVTFNSDHTHELDLEFSTSDFEIAVSQEWEGRLTWNERDMSRYTYFVTLSYDRDLGFSRSNFENTVRNERAVWHGTKGLWVERILDSHYDFELWPHPWPWTWIFMAIFFNSCISGMGEPINVEQKWYESMGCYT